MAKLRGAAKAAFIRRMMAGRRHAARRRQPVVRRRRKTANYLVNIKRRNPMSALIANPSWVPSYYGQDSEKRARKQRRHVMAKRRRRGRRRASPRRRRVYRRRSSPRRRRRSPLRLRARRYIHRRRPRIAHVRRGTKLIYINPRRRRRAHRRRRNPGMGGIVNILKSAFVPYAAGFATSMVAAVADTALSKYPVVTNLVKVGGVVAIAAFGGRRYPRASAAAIGSLAASTGYRLGTQLAGGMVASTPAQAVKGLAEMSRVHPEMGALLNGGIGALLNGPDNVDAMTSNYETALHNMADDDY